MQEIKSVYILSVGKISGIVYASMVLLFIPFFLVIGLSLIPGQKEAAIGGAMFLVFALIAPFLYGFMGFVMGVFMAWIYNLVAKRFGGIKLELQPVQAIVPPPSGIM
jgi:hypothetical protein